MMVTFLGHNSIFLSKTGILSVRSRSHSVIDDGIYEIMLQRRLSTCIVQLDTSEHAARQVLLQVPFWPLQDRLDRLKPHAAQSKSTTCSAMRLRKPMLLFRRVAPVRGPRSHGPVSFQGCKKSRHYHSPRKRSSFKLRPVKSERTSPRPQEIWKAKLPTSLEFFHLLIQSWTSRITI